MHALRPYGSTLPCHKDGIRPSCVMQLRNCCVLTTYVLRQAHRHATDPAAPPLLRSMRCTVPVCRHA